MAKFWGRGKFPYTNINNLNLDWMIKQVLELKAQVDALVGEIGDVYVKPETGIPKSDLSAGVQESLNKADTALQAIPASYRTAADQDVIDNAQNEKINPLYNPLALEGSQISFTAEAAAIPDSFILNVQPAQSGSGTPSPTNPRALAARNEISITHNGDTINIPLMSAAPTYGGKLDLLSGIYSDFGRIVNLSDLNWTRSASTGFFYAPVPGRIVQNPEPFFYCSHYQYIGSGSINWISANLNNGQIAAQSAATYVRIRDDRFTTVDAFLAANESTQIVFRGAATQHKIPVSDVLPVSGSNNYTTSSGSFSAIVNAYLDALTNAVKRAAPAVMVADVESGTVSHAYSNNDFLIYNNQLCRVTAPIQSGGTIQIGVNAVITTLGAEITAILNS
jgi:hypothetical protein